MCIPFFILALNSMPNSVCTSVIDFVRTLWLSMFALNLQYLMVQLQMKGCLVWILNEKNGISCRHHHRLIRMNGYAFAGPNDVVHLIGQCHRPSQTFRRWKKLQFFCICFAHFSLFVTLALTLPSLFLRATFFFWCFSRIALICVDWLGNLFGVLKLVDVFEVVTMPEMVRAARSNSNSKFE